jgi:hypothetical protein
MRCSGLNSPSKSHQRDATASNLAISSWSMFCGVAEADVDDVVVMSVMNSLYLDVADYTYFVCFGSDLSLWRIFIRNEALCAKV